MSFNKSIILKTTLWAALSHVILIALSFLEVFIYSILINPGQEESVYSDHASVSAPYVAIIGGIVLFLFLARRLATKHPEAKRPIWILLPTFYVIFDLLILIPYGVDWGDHWVAFVLSFGTKFISAFIGTRISIGAS